MVSVIAGDPRVNENPIGGFTNGVAHAVPGAKVLVDYSHDFSHPSVCAAIANRQIDQGSTSVFADAGACSVGALSTAEVRGVWGVGADEDMSYLGPQILVSTVKRLDRAVDYAVRSYLAGTLPQGHLDIGIERDAVGIVGINGSSSSFDSCEARASPATAHEAMDLLGDALEVIAYAGRNADVLALASSDNSKPRRAGGGAHPFVIGDESCVVAAELLRGGEMDRVQGAQLGRHELTGSIEKRGR